jgi:predicted adenylyl cyclase CyaB
MNIEVEVRSFISPEKYSELLEYFKANAKLLKEDYQESYYFDCEADLRIQRNTHGAKIWMKQGQIHDDHREELEIEVDREDFNKLEQLFINLGYQVEIKWFRRRFEFKWNSITVCLDYTKGYGYIIELEKMTNKDEQEQIHLHLMEKMKELKINISSKDEFAEKFNYYKANWRELTQSE